MARSVPMIGLSTDELPWVRRLVGLLRHPDPTVRELARQALLYVTRASERAGLPRAALARPCKKNSMLNCMK